MTVCILLLMLLFGAKAAPMFAGWFGRRVPEYSKGKFAQKYALGHELPNDPMSSATRSIFHCKHRTGLFAVFPFKCAVETGPEPAKEAYILTKVLDRSYRTVRCIEVFRESDGKTILVFEPAQGYVPLSEFPVNNWTVATSIFMNIVAAAEVLAARGVVHNDLQVPASACPPCLPIMS